MTPPTEEIKSQSNIAIAETYLEAIQTKDLSKALFAPNVTLQFPVSPIKIVGRENVNEYLASMIAGTDAVKLERHMTGGDYVATLWEAQTVWGTVPICTVFRIADGLIQEIRRAFLRSLSFASFWDPRPVTQQKINVYPPRASSSPVPATSSTFDPRASMRGGTVARIFTSSSVAPTL